MLIVQKYGGTSLGDTQRIRSAADEMITGINQSLQKLEKHEQRKTREEGR